MSLNFSAIRAAFTTQIQTVSGFKLTKQSPSYFGRTRETVVHKAFVVSVDQTNQVVEERQRRTIGVYVQSNVQVRFSFRLRPMDMYPNDYDNALNAEVQVINACMKSYAAINNKVQVRYISSSRLVTESQEYMIHTIDFTVLHTIGE